MGDDTKSEKILLALIEYGFDRLMQQCKEDLPRAGGLFLACLAGLDETIRQLWYSNGQGPQSISLISEAVIQACPPLQSLFLSIEACGGLVIEDSIGIMFDRPSQWSEDLTLLCKQVSELLITLRALRRGNVQLAFVDGIVLSRPHLEQLQSLNEQKINRAAFESVLPVPSPEPDMLTSPEASRALREAFGFGFDDLMRLLISRLELWQGATNHIGPLLIVSTTELDQLQQQICESLQLNIQIVREYQLPFWFGLSAKRRESLLSLKELLAEACVENWITCFPIFRAVSKACDQAVLVAPQLLYCSLGLLENFQGRILNRLTKNMPKLGQLQQKSSRAFENRVGEIATNKGWTTLVSLERYGGEVLDCGEIDLLCGHFGQVHSTVVLCEIKHFDISVERDIDLARCKSGIAKATSQLNRKATWIESHRPGIADLLKLRADFTLKSIVVSRRYVAPPLTGGYPIICVAAFSTYLDRCASGADKFWWKPIA